MIEVPHIILKSGNSVIDPQYVAQEHFRRMEPGQSGWVQWRVNDDSIVMKLLLDSFRPMEESG